ncbi:MAG: DUF2752 domain-containing protein [Planctomycetia bacterium]|nr:DUF2752 domain-containing protein [Planctomycetia bacterium]
MLSSSPDSTATLEQPTGLPSPAPAIATSNTRIGYHALMACGAAGILLLAAVMHLSAGGLVTLPLVGTLPGMCIWHRVLGFDCPGCGLTRSFVALAHGQFIRAWQFNPAGPLMFALVAYQVPFHVVQIFRLRNGRGEFKHRPLTVALVSWLVVAALITQWAFRMWG